MKLAVRALSVFLTVWLAAAGTFPACCWSATPAHNHPTPPTDSGIEMESHHHQHHRVADSAAAVPPTSVLSAKATSGCDTTPVDAVMTPTVTPSRADALTLDGATPETAVPPVRADFAFVSDPVPPGASPGSTFLHPLRI
jgi:hypothetical protein